MASSYSVDRRASGRIVDFRIELDQAPTPLILSLIERALRRNDVVISSEGDEVSVALSGTTVDNVEKIVAPRLRRLLECQRYECQFTVNGQRLP
jgi:hypothetical protein